MLRTVIAMVEQFGGLIVENYNRSKKEILPITKPFNHGTIQ
jgi:hypothetical protein